MKIWNFIDRRKKKRNRIEIGTLLFLRKTFFTLISRLKVSSFTFIRVNVNRVVQPLFEITFFVQFS